MTHYRKVSALLAVDDEALEEGFVAADRAWEEAVDGLTETLAGSEARLLAAFGPDDVPGGTPLAEQCDTLEREWHERQEVDA